MTTARLVPRSRCIKAGRVRLAWPRAHRSHRPQVTRQSLPGSRRGGRARCSHRGHPRGGGAAPARGEVRQLAGRCPADDQSGGQSGEAQATSRRSRLLCGVAARPASLGLTTLHRLNRGAGRAANSAIHIAAPGRMRTDDRTRAEVARKMSKGHSKLEAIRCVKRYIVRELYYDIIAQSRMLKTT